MRENDDDNLPNNNIPEESRWNEERLASIAIILVKGVLITILLILAGSLIASLIHSTPNTVPSSQATITPENFYQGKHVTVLWQERVASMGGGYYYDLIKITIPEDHVTCYTTNRYEPVSCIPDVGWR